MSELKPCKRCEAVTNGVLGMCDPCWELSRHLDNITSADVPEAMRREIISAYKQSPEFEALSDKTYDLGVRAGWSAGMKEDDSVLRSADRARQEANKVLRGSE